MKRLHPGLETQARIADGWVDNFLTLELEYVLPYLRSRKNIVFRRKGVKELLFNDRFMTCIKAAPEFSEYLETQNQKLKRG